MLLFFSAFKRTVIFLQLSKASYYQKNCQCPRDTYEPHFPPPQPTVAPPILPRILCQPPGSYVSPQDHQPPTSDATSSSPQPCPALDCSQRGAQCLGLPWCPPAALILAGGVGWSLAVCPALTDPWGIPTAPWHLPPKKY